MQYHLQIDDSNNDFTEFEKYMRQFRPGKDFLREIKLNSLLGKKSLITLEDMKTSMGSPYYIDCNDDNDILLGDAIATIESIEVIVDSELKIESLKVNVKFLENEKGKIYEKLKNNLNLYTKKDSWRFILK
jgi:endonuclease IV